MTSQILKHPKCFRPSGVPNIIHANTCISTCTVVQTQIWVNN